MPALSPVAHPFRGEALPRAYRAASNASSALLRIALAGSLTSNVLLIHCVKSVKSHEAWPQRRSTVRIPTITSRTGEQMKATARRVGLNCAALALAMIGVICPAQTAKSAATAANDTYKMKQVQVIDRAGLGQPTPAADLLIPTDWKFESNVQWENRGCFTDLAAITFRAQSPDGRLVIEAFPSFSWQWASDPAVQKYLVMEDRQGAQVGLKPCPVNPPVPAADVLRKFALPKYRSGKDAGTVEPIPNFDQSMNSRARSLEQQSARAGQQLQFRADSARIRLKYEIDGHPVEEWVTAVSVAQASTISTGSGATQGIDCRAVMVYALRAPQGQLDASEKLFRMILSSVRREPDWQRQYLTIVAKLSAAQQAQRQTCAQILRQFQQHELAVIQGVMANQQRGADQAFVAADQLIRGVEPYRDPATGKTYELSNLYGHAWMNANNEFVLSENPNFNPASAFNGDWKPLDHVQPAP